MGKLTTLNENSSDHIKASSEALQNILSEMKPYWTVIKRYWTEEEVNTLNLKIYRMINLEILSTNMEYVIHLGINYNLGKELEKDCLLFW